MDDSSTLKPVALAIAVCIAFAALPALAQSKRISGKSWFGCVSRDVHSKLTGMAVAGDREAFAKGLMRSILAGQCIQLQQGQAVHVTDTAILSGMVQVRPSGEPDSYWTNLEAIK